MKDLTRAALLRRLTLFGSLASVAGLAFACSPAGKDSTVLSSTTSGGSGATSSPSTTGGSVSGGPAAPSSGGGIVIAGDIPVEMPNGPCQGLECQVQACDGMSKTTISGKIYDPAGKVPLYNVAVYVPNAPVQPFKEGASCDRCGSSIVNPVTSAITDESGSFVLQDAPSGSNIPLVIQVGKWRRQLMLPAVNPCADNAFTDPQMMRLPRNKAEGDIPKIAISVGSADQMECLPLRMGIDPAEITPAGGDGRINLFVGDYQGNRTPVLALDAAHGSTPLTPSSTGLWSSVDSLMKYDIVILSCEGNSYENRKPMQTRQALYDYESQGGRVFASHWHNVWFANGPAPVPSTGTWTNRPNPTDNGGPITATINQSFPKGAALAQWLVNVGASTTLGQMTVDYPRDNLQAVNTMVAREWISVDNPKVDPGEDPKSTQYMSYNAPIGAPEDQICGRAVYTNLHVASVDNTSDQNALGFPASCEMRDLSAQEKAVAFMLFDLSACVQSEDVPPKPPR